MPYECLYAIHADVAIRLARYFETSAQFWMNLQMEYSLAAYG